MAFTDLMKGFGVVTVMDVEMCDHIDVEGSADLEAAVLAIKTGMATAEGSGTPTNGYIKLDTLKISNMTIEGPTKTATGGRYNNTLIKYGKTGRLEMQEALGKGDAIAELCGGVVDATLQALSITDGFGGPKTIVGDTFMVEQATGAQVPVKIVIFEFLPDSILNLTQEADGDVSVFDMNGDLLINRVAETGYFYTVMTKTDYDALTA